MGVVSTLLVAVLKFMLLSPAQLSRQSGWMQHWRFYRAADAVCEKACERSIELEPQKRNDQAGRRRSDAMNGSRFSAWAPPTPITLADKGRARIHDKPAAQACLAKAANNVAVQFTGAPPTGKHSPGRRHHHQAGTRTGQSVSASIRTIVTGKQSQI